MPLFYRQLLVLFLILSSSSAAFAQTASYATTTPDVEAKRLRKPSEAVGTLGNDMFGEQVDLYGGDVSFHATDIDLPGNNGLKVHLARTRKIDAEDGFYPLQSLGDWELEVPHLSGIFANELGWVVGGASPNSRCSGGNGTPPDSTAGGGYFMAEDYWQGYKLHVPDGTDEDLLFSTVNSQNRDSNPARWTTKSHWLIECLPALQSGGTGEGFVATSPEGTRYYFDRMIKRSSGHRLSRIKQIIGTTLTPMGFCRSSVPVTRYRYIYLADGAGGGGYMSVPTTDWVGGSTDCATYTTGIRTAVLSRDKIYLAASRVEDRFGNWVSYQYNSNGHVAEINSSDSRKILFNYSTINNTSRLTSAVAGTRTWNFAYSSDAAALTKVTQPDSRSWTYQAAGTIVTPRMPVNQEPGVQTFDCFLNYYLNDFSADPGYSYSVQHPSGATGKFDFKPIMQNNPALLDCNNPESMYYASGLHIALQKKHISGPALSPVEWSYRYIGGEGGGTIPCKEFTECNATVSTQVTSPSNVIDTFTFYNTGFIDQGKIKTVTQTGNAGILKKVSSVLSNTPIKIGVSPLPKLQSQRHEYDQPVARRVIEQDGTTFTWQANQFDPFGRATDVTRSSSLGFSKTELVSYHDNRTNWTLGQLASVADVASQKIEVFRNFDPVSALITSQLEFGQPVGTYTWNTDGTLANVKDANNNSTSFSNYYRGIPQRITHADASFETGVINDNGWITSMTDVRNNTTGFGYDAMGRLNTITPPVGDTVAWNSTTLSFDKLATAAYGLPAGAWKLSLSKGNYRKETFLDAMWRPVVTREYDNINVTDTQRFTRQAYDTEGRVVFASYPGKGDLITQGIHNEYDGLGRITKVTQDSEPGVVLTSTTEYLTGFKTKTTNPRGFYTLTNYMAWDSPDMSLPMRIEAAEDTLTEITRDGFGKPLSVKRSSLSDSSITNSRIYAYNDQQRLCQRTELESGTTVISYDAVGNLQWSAPGQTVANTSVCNLGAVPTAARITRSYDGLNRLKTLDVPNSTNDLSYTYAGGLLQTLSNGGVTWNYSYNKLGLPQTETLTLDSLTKVIGHRYDANAVEDQLTLPSNLAIAYSPNALGQATQAGAFASNARYRSNGAISGFNYGNGVVHSTLLNLRGLPAQRSDKLGATLVQHEDVAFDANGNVLCMRDNTSGNGAHRDMQYDGQDRLTNTYAPNQWWINASTSYDVLDNIRTSTVGNRKHTYVYDASQRLNKITKPFGTTPSPQSTGNSIACNNMALADDIGTLSPEGSGTVEPPYTGGGTTPPGGGNPPGGGGCQYDCGGGGQQQNAVAPTTTTTALRSASRSASTGGVSTMSAPGDGGIPEAPITVYQMAYDANGNIITGRNPAVFDALNRLTEVTGKEKYLYDGHGRRVKTTRVSDTKVNYSIYSLNGQLVTEDDGRTNKKTDYIQLNGRLVAQRSAALTGTTAQTTTYTNSYLHTDSLGSPVAQTNQAGTITKIERYTPYGEPSDSSYDQGPGFTGHITDSLTGLTYAQQRYYDPVVGRFLSVDPVETDPNNGASFNRYKYASNNPYKFVDPDGRMDGAVADRYADNFHNMPRETQIQSGVLGIAAVGVVLAYPAIAYVGVAALANPIAATSIAEAAIVTTVGVTTGGSIPSPASAIVSVEAKAAQLSQKIGTNSVTVKTGAGQVRVDLQGAFHHSKATQTSIPTPHVQTYKNNVIPSGPRAGQVGSITSTGTVTGATKQDLKAVERVLKERDKK